MYERYLGKDVRNHWTLYHHNLQSPDLKIEIFPYQKTQARRSLITWLRKLNGLLYLFLGYWVTLWNLWKYLNSVATLKRCHQKIKKVGLKLVTTK